MRNNAEGVISTEFAIGDSYRSLQRQAEKIKTIFEQLKEGQLVYVKAQYGREFEAAQVSKIYTDSNQTVVLKPVGEVVSEEFRFGEVHIELGGIIDIKILDADPSEEAMARIAEERDEIRRTVGLLNERDKVSVITREAGEVEGKVFGVYQEHIVYIKISDKETRQRLEQEKVNGYSSHSKTLRINTEALKSITIR